MMNLLCLISGRHRTKKLIHYIFSIKDLTKRMRLYSLSTVGDWNCFYCSISIAAPLLMGSLFHTCLSSYHYKNENPRKQSKYYLLLLGISWMPRDSFGNMECLKALPALSFQWSHCRWEARIKINDLIIEAPDFTA